MTINLHHHPHRHRPGGKMMFVRKILTLSWLDSKSATGQAAINKFLFIWLLICTLVFGRVTYLWVTAGGIWQEQMKSYQQTMEQWKKDEAVKPQYQKKSFVKMQWLKD